MSRLLRRRKILQAQQQENESAKIIDTTPAHPIGIYLQRNETKWLTHASDRIRGEWILKYSPAMELYVPGKRYEAAIFHIPCKAISESLAEIKILDICDKVWEKNPSEFLELIKPIQAIIVPTEILKQELSKVTDKKIHVIADGHDMAHYAARIPNLHERRAKEIVWFGYTQNAHVLKPFVNYIKTMGIKLKVIAQWEESLEYADQFIEWNVNSYIKEISKSDFAFLPANQDYKSDNKEITALLCGIPVAKTKEDIARLIFPNERKEEMLKRTPDLSKYNVKYRAEEYMRVIEELKKSNPIQVYSSIAGNFDKPRNDIKIFTDQKTDLFKRPVMNAKIYKALAHKYISSSISIYLDGNIFLNIDTKFLADEFLQDADMALFKHPWRNCLYKEYEHANKRIPAEFLPLMSEQVYNYRKEGMPENFGLAECGMIIRRNNDAVNEFNERWWAEICRYTNRDQMSFPYVWWKMKDCIKIKLIDGNVREHKYFKYIIH